MKKINTILIFLTLLSCDFDNKYSDQEPLSKVSLNYIEKEFKFKNYVLSEKFILEVGKIAELEGHHPDIWFGWGYAKVKIFTHAIKGLAESDFILAAKIDKIPSDENV